MFKEIDFTPGKIVYNDFNIDANIPFEQQIFSLKDDILQVNYNDKYLIDVGWGPEFDLSGKFKIRIIKDLNWKKPMYFKRTNSLDNLYKIVRDCVKIIKNNLDASSITKKALKNKPF